MASAVLTEELSREGRAAFEALLAADEDPVARQQAPSVAEHNRSWLQDLRASGVPVPAVRR